MFLRHLVCWPSFDIRDKFYVDRPRGTPSGEVISRKRCKIGGKLVLITIYGFLLVITYMGFRLVRKSVTLNDLERHHDLIFRFFSPNSVASGAHCLNAVEYVVAKKVHVRYLVSW